jgi:hypothetical protein
MSLTGRDILETAEDRAGRLVLADLHHDCRDGRVEYAEEGEDDQVGDDHEEVVPRDHRTVEAGVGWGTLKVQSRTPDIMQNRRTLVLADLADDDGQEVAEDERNCGWQNTGNDGELGHPSALPRK